MIEIPWLRSDVAANIRNNFAFYFGYERFGLYAACVAAIIVLNCLAVKFFFAGEYRFSTEDRHFFFNWKDKTELAGAAALAFSFLLYAFNLFSLELSVFGNYDQMQINNIYDMVRGQQPIFTSMRFNPIAGIDHNVIYGITNHYTLIGGWVLLKQALCLWLLYRFFAFVPTVRRLLMLAAINFLPAVFWVNGIVYSEQNTLIFVLLSLTALQKYDGQHGLRQLLWFALWANLAIYTKEINIFVYFGIFLYLVLAKVWAEKITLRSFLSPFKTVTGMPAEYILFWSMLLFSAGYLLLSDLLTGGAYVRHHQQELPTLLAVNAVELCLAAAALVVFVRKVLCRGFEETGAVAEGVLSGCLIIVYYVVFHLQIACFPDRYKTWYMYLPSVFCTAYLFINVKDRRLLAAFFVPLMLWSAWLNFWIRKQEEGTERRELAEFITSVANEQVSFFVSGKDSNDLWKLEAFNSALKYTVGGNNIRFKTNMEISSAKQRFLTDKYYYEMKQEAPTDGDYVIARDDEESHPKNCGETIWQNRVYLVCRVKNKY